MTNNLFLKNNLNLSFVKKYWHVSILMGILILSFGLNFYAISKLGYGNAYYAAAIKSMTQSFKNFFFVSFDPAGMVSVDKPPLGLWVQALFVLVFGYHGWVMLLPQALAGTGSSLMMYLLTAKYFGRPAGLISSLVFALTPAVVVASRNNTMDTQLIFVLLTATWFLFKAIEKAKWRYLFLTAIMVGLGFNIKMLQAYMILPAIVIVYLLFAKEPFAKSFTAGLISVAILAVVSFAWVFAVDLYPSDSRPYVGSSANNTVMELIIGHNGLERIYGQGSRVSGNMGQGGPDGGQRSDNRQDGGTQQPNMQNPGNPPTGKHDGVGTPPAIPEQAPSDHFNREGRMDGGAPGGGGVTGNEIGTAGIFRLWSQNLYGQASWLIIFAVLCMVACIRKFNIKQLTLKQGVFVYWALWLLTMFIFFSFASFYHRYYLCMAAPGIAGLAGIGTVEMFKAFRDKLGWRQWTLPFSLLATLIVEIVYAWNYSQLRTWLIPIMAGTALVSILLLVIYYVNLKKFALIAATIFMLLSILTAPFYWTLTVVMYVPENVTMPYAGPELSSTSKTPGMTQNQETFISSDNTTLSLENYLVEHYREGSYLVVSQRANDVAQFIVDTGLPAVAYGGFLGSDNALTLDKLKNLVKQGKITYFLVSGQSNGGSGSELISYVKENATLIDASEYGASSSQSNDFSKMNLYYFS